MKTGARKKKRGASILLLSFFFMIVLFLLATALYKLVPAEMHAAYRDTEDTKAHYVARSGIQETMSWLKYRIEQYDLAQSETELPDYNSGTTASPTFDNIIAFESQIEAASPVDDPNWTLDIEILPLQDSIGQNHGFEPRFYSVRATSLHKGRAVRSIDVLLKQRTFSAFALYTEQMDPDSKFIIDGTASVFGPVHTNDHFRFEAAPGLWGDTNAEAYFSDIVSFATPHSSSPDGAEWLGGATNSPYGNTDGTGYEKVFAKGQNGLRQKNEIDLPSSTSTIVDEVWTNTTAPLPTDAYAHLGVDATATGANGQPLVTGGVYVGKSVDDVELRLDSAGNQRTRLMNYWENTGQIPDPNATTSEHDPNCTHDRHYTTTDWNNCLVYAPPGSAGGINGGNVNNCIQYAQIDHYDGHYYIQVPDPGATTTERTNFYTQVYEVTEAPVTFTDSSGTDHVAQIGQTLVSRERRVRDADGNWSDYITDGVDVYDGQINGTFYVNGDIGSRWSGGNQGGGNGLWGIAKGSAVTDSTGAIKTNPTTGDREYLNKTFVTPLSRGVNLAGDLLQFNQDKFEDQRDNHNLNFAGTFNDGNGTEYNWSKAALDPNRVDAGNNHDPELSPNNDHVLGIITRDAWMKGRKNSHIENGRDGYNDIYAVILAGKSESNGDSSGGFGTWYQQRDHINDGLGQYRVFGGVIQGTTGSNQGDNSNYSHYWTSGGVGYEASLFYDIEATRQRLFPTFPEFRIIRYLERSARK